MIGLQRSVSGSLPVEHSLVMICDGGGNFEWEWDKDEWIRTAPGAIWVAVIEDGQRVGVTFERWAEEPNSEKDPRDDVATLTADTFINVPTGFVVGWSLTIYVDPPISLELSPGVEWNCRVTRWNYRFHEADRLRFQFWLTDR